MTPQMRAESYAERIGDITITCIGGSAPAVGAQVPSVNITVFLNTQITSRTYAGGGSEALLLVDEPGSSTLAGATNTQLACNDPNGVCTVLSTGGALGTYDGSAGHPNIFTGVVSSNSVTFYGVPIEAPGTTGFTRTLRITNIRANATTLNFGPNTEVPVIVSIAVTNTTALPILNATQTVGFVVGGGVSFSVRTPDNSALSGGAVAIPCSTTPRVGVLRFAENFGTAFATRTAAPFVDSDTSPAPAVLNVPGLVYLSESGFYNPALTASAVDFATVGLADAGTRLRATFNNVPPGTRVYVSATGVTYSNSNPSAVTTGSVARLIQNEALPFAAVAPTTTLEGVPAVELLVTNGSATAVWEVLGTDPSRMENFDFVVWAQGSSTLPGAASVNGSLAPAPPVFDAAAGSMASSTLPLPRFIADPNAAEPLFTAGNCEVITAPVLTAGTPTFGNQLTFSSTVGPTAPPTSDTITFLDGPISIGAGNVNASGVATVTTALLSVGPHSITAHFNGDSTFAGLTSGALNLAVASAPANATVSSPSVGAGQTVSFGTPVMVTANFTVATTLSPASQDFRAVAAKGISARVASLPPGTATFTDTASSASCQAPINAGTASCSLSFVSAGSHTITVASGINYTVADVGTLTFSIAKALTGTTLAASINTASTGQNVTLTATVNPGGATAGGTVSFTNGGAPIGNCGAVALAGVPGAAVTAACVVSFQTGGNLNLAAAYSGDSNTAPSSATLLETVSNPSSPDTLVTVAVSQNPATVGQPVTFTATVSGGSGMGSPTGSVQFSDGRTPLGTVPLTGGQASVTTAFTTAGSHGISASYGGDSNFPGSSRTIGILVLGSATSLTLTANPNVSLFGQAVALTASLGTGGPAGVSAPSGQVQFFDGAALLGSAAIGSGAAAFTVSSLVPGVHQLKAAYSGDTTWSPSTSGAVAQTVGRAPTAITLISASGATQATLSSAVAAMSPVAAIPSGSVQYMDTGTNGVFATANLAGGSATATVGSAGRMIVAVYSGDAYFLGSSSAPAAQLWIGNGAAFGSATFAPNEIVTLMGPNLAASTVSAELPLPVSLGGIAVTVTDSAGATHPATLYYVSPGQINFILPGGLPSGPATVAVNNTVNNTGAVGSQGGIAPSITIAVAPLAPGIFTASANGKGAAQGLVLDVQSTGQSTLNTNNPIGLNSTDAYYLELFGTGFDNASQTAVTINGQSIPVLFAGTQQQYLGLDQINVGPLPANLIGAGTVNVEVSVHGQAANTVTLTFQ